MTACHLPEDSLLSTYRTQGAYTDCYVTDIETTVTQPEYIEAFYTTFLFRMERTILKWALSKPSTDEEAHALAESAVNAFAAWTVEARTDDQLLMSDYRGRTRSWLMSSPRTGGSKSGTRLYFGSAVVPIRSKQSGQRKMGGLFSALLPFHRLYSRALLLSAKNRLSRR